MKLFGRFIHNFQLLQYRGIVLVQPNDLGVTKMIFLINGLV